MEKEFISMKEFDCLALETPLEGKLFVEASAGTGKTFAIEHVVARLVLKGFPIDSILITTFTNAGARDLKLRIYQNLRKLIKNEIAPPYMKGFESSAATFLLKTALSVIDDAQIFTIHSFCHKMLSQFSFEANIDADLIDPEKGMGKETLEIASLDVLRSILDSDEFSPAQLTKLMGQFKRETKNFVKKMISFLSGNPKLPETKTYKELYDEFQLKCSDVKEELLAIAPFYNKTSNRSGSLHAFILEQIDALSEGNFEKLILSNPSIFELFTEDNRKKNSTVETHWIIEALAPILLEASDPFILFCRMAKKVQKLLETRNEGPNILLETMCKALLHSPFKMKVSEKYKAVIIDEFQDTDPLQWSIFSCLRPDLLLVVGDPKQSIYAFRGADLQTFLDAKKEFSSIFQLSSNYRSDPILITSLNKLFQTPELFTLSEKGLDFSYEPLQAKKKSSGKLTEDPFQFALINSEEEEDTFSFIAHEINRLGDLFTYAILVKDRFEAFRIAAYLELQGLSVITTATANIAEGEAFKFLFLISQIVKSPKNMSLAKQILAHPFIGWPLEKLGEMPNDEALLPFIKLSISYKEDNLATFITNLFKLIHVDSREDYADLMQMTGLLLENNPESLHNYLEKLSLLEADDNPYLKRKPVTDNCNITIMTSHMSKGLEFDIVFALGTAVRQKPAALKSPLSQDLEKLRLFYVAATRAKEKLYLFVKIAKEEAKIGSKSPIELLLAKLKCPSANYDALPTLTLEDVRKVLTENQFAFTEIDGPYVITKKNLQTTWEEVQQITLPSFLPPRQFSSFSSLNSSHVTSAVPKETDLPPGSETGTIFHELLEKMIETGSYVDWNELSIKKFINQVIFKTHLENYQTVVYELIYAAFHTTLDDFCLRDVAPEYMLQEHAFAYKLEGRSYMKGVIDLVFLYEEKYYILDWKMNLLPSYNPATLKIAMTEHSYFSQAAIYKEALERAFKDFPFSNTFYFFLRGKENGVVKL